MFVNPNVIQPQIVRSPPDNNSPVSVSQNSSAPNSSTTQFGHEVHQVIVLVSNVVIYRRSSPLRKRPQRLDWSHRQNAFGCGCTVAACVTGCPNSFVLFSFVKSDLNGLSNRKIGDFYVGTCHGFLVVGKCQVFWSERRGWDFFSTF